MFAVNILGAPAWLIPYGPNTSDTVKVRASIEVDVQRGLTGRSSRRPQAVLNRHEQEWSSVMKPREFYAARAAVLSAQDEPIAAPFWLAARKTTQAPLMTTGLTVAWTRDWSAYAINPGSLDGYDYHAPLIVGILAQPPRLTARNSDFVVVEWSLTENAPAAAALTPPESADTTLATPDGYAAAVFPFTPEGSTAPLASFGQVDADRQQIGPGRESAEIYYPQARETVVQPSYKLKTAADAVALLGWWQRRGGGADALWVATTQAIGRLTADLPSGSVSIAAAEPLSGVNVGDTLALVTTGIAPEFVRVDAVVAGVAHLTAGTAVDHPANWTILVPALLARHTDPKLELELHRADEEWMTTCTLGFREVTPEYAATDGEVRGTTLGKLPPAAWLAKIDLDYSGAIQSWYVSNWESGGTTPDDQLWEYHPWDFDSLTQSIDLEQDEMSFTIRSWDGSPFENWLPGQLASVGTITIYKAPVIGIATLGDPAQKWQGTLTKPSTDGPIIATKNPGANAFFSQQSPQATMTPTCWKRPYGVKCGLAIADWRFTAVISVIAGQQITIDTIARENGAGLPAGFGFDGWFALGFAEWLDAGGHPLRAEVLASTALNAGAITLTVGRMLDWHVGDAVVAVPWCDKTKETCSAYDADTNPLGKFDNFTANFGGFFDQPAVSPNFVVPNTTATPAKK